MIVRAMRSKRGTRSTRGRADLARASRFSVVEAWSFVAATVRELVVASGGAVDLEEEIRVHHAPEHDLLGPRANRFHRFVAGELSEARIPVLAKIGDRRGEIQIRDAGSIIVVISARSWRPFP